MYKHVAAEVIKSPLPKPLTLRNVTWVVVTESTYPSLSRKSAESGEPLVLFGITPKDYENMVYNVEKISTYVQETQNLIVYYDKVLTTLKENDHAE